MNIGDIVIIDEIGTGEIKNFYDDIVDVNSGTWIMSVQKNRVKLIEDEAVKHKVRLRLYKNEV